MNKKKFSLRPERTSAQSQPAKQNEVQKRTEEFIRDKEPTRSKTFMIPISLGKALKKRAADEGRTDTAIIIQLLQQYLSK
jgi:hypothetical protein